MTTSISPGKRTEQTVAVVVAPGPRPDPGLHSDRLARHREFYLKSPHTVVPSGTRLRYRPALGQLSYRAQLGLVFADTPRHTSASRILEYVREICLSVELYSLDLLRVGWEGTMWHIRYGEGASFDDSCVVAELQPSAGIVGTPVELSDAWGSAAVDWGSVAEFCEHVNHWMALRPDMLILAGSQHGPLLSIKDDDAIVRFEDDEPRLAPGDALEVSSRELGAVTATITSLDEAEG